MDEEKIEAIEQDAKLRSKIKVSSILLILFIASTVLFVWLYAANSNGCSERLAKQETEFNLTSVNLANFVAQDVTANIIDKIVESTNDCKMVTVFNDKNNVTRQLADVNCIEKAYVEFLSKQLNNTQG